MPITHHMAKDFHGVFPVNGTIMCALCSDPSAALREAMGLTIHLGGTDPGVYGIVLCDTAVELVRCDDDGKEQKYRVREGDVVWLAGQFAIEANMGYRVVMVRDAYVMAVMERERAKQLGIALVGGLKPQRPTLSRAV